MANYYKLVQDIVTPLPTELFGLKYNPTLEPHVPDAAEWYDSVNIPHVPQEFSDANQFLLRETFNSIKDTAKCILEIGVHRQPQHHTNTSTFVLLSSKNKETVYIGADIDQREWLDDATHNVHTLRIDSGKTKYVYELMDRLGQQTFDFIFIDGWHSVDQCLKDWKYVERLRVGGIVGIHDTNYHAGPCALFEAIDTEYFEKTRYEISDQDWGIAFAKRRK